MMNVQATGRDEVPERPVWKQLVVNDRRDDPQYGEGQQECGEMVERERALFASSEAGQRRVMVSGPAATVSRPSE